ncbi:hypothetical protein, partial [Streptomyces hydrogenans]|uniref:hypothetical protein n=1 Tax=Streptomyces hydrogenans TaxID=1873719 RepID=UPI0035DF9118
MDVPHTADRYGVTPGDPREGSHHRQSLINAMPHREAPFPSKVNMQNAELPISAKGVPTSRTDFNTPAPDLLLPL